MLCLLSVSAPRSSLAAGTLSPPMPTGSRSVTYSKVGYAPNTQTAPDTSVVINELLAHSDPPFEDAIELYNDSNQAVSIGGWFLSDIANQPKKFRIPAGTVLAPFGYAVFYEYQFDPTPGRPPSFGLSEHGDEIYLFAASPTGDLTGYTTSARFEASGTNLSVGRTATSTGVDFTQLSAPTFGVSNPTSIRHFRTGKGAANSRPRFGPILINEVMYHPAEAVDEYVELLNTSTVAVPLHDPFVPTHTWRIKDGITYRFPGNTVLPGGGYLLVVPIEPSQFRDRYDIPLSVQIFGPYDGNLSNSGESIELAKPDEEDYGFVPYVMVDHVKYGDDTPWPVPPDGGGSSLERVSPLAYGNDPANWASSQDGGTPGYPNSAQYPERMRYLPLLTHP